MDKVKTIKLTRLSCGRGSHYLEASPCTKLVKIIEGNKRGATTLPDSTLWRIMWLDDGKCCFWSIFNKVLTAYAKEGHSFGIVKQAEWPTECSSKKIKGSARWDAQFSFDSSNKVTLKLSIQIADESYLFYGLPDQCWVVNDTWYYRMLYINWGVEVVEYATKDDQVSKKNKKKIKGDNDNNEQNGSQQQHHHDPNCKDDLSAGLLSKCTVGQMVFNVVGGVSVTGGDVRNFSYYDSGHNVNVSGTQTLGGIKHKQIDRC